MRVSAALPEGTSIDRLLMLPWEYTRETRGIGYLE